MKLEIIGFNIESCIAAQSAGADRIELCDNPGEGGTTPSYGFIKSARKHLSIDLYVMIRPRGGDFLYSDEEFEIMKTDIEICKELGCDGIVFGMLDRDGNVDTERCRKLLGYSYPLGSTFHRAFDRLADPFGGMEDIIEAGFERILTSGLKPKAFEGAKLLRELVLKADNRIIIMPGSGVTSENIVSLAKSTGATELHSSGSKYVESRMDYLNESMHEKLEHIVTNEKEVYAMSELIKRFR